MSTGLDTALEGIDIPQATGEGSQPGAPGSAAPEIVPPADGDGEGTNAGETPKDDIGEGQEGTEEKTQEQILEELRQAAEPQPTDTSTIKQLRELLKTRVDKLVPQDPGQGEAALSDSDRERLDMVQGLFDYDIENDRPTTRPFVEKLAAKDHTLVGQLLLDSINVPVPNTEIRGWTYGHELLQQMGLDPMKFPDLVRFSRGEISGEAFGIEQMPEYVPAEYHEAYKQLNPVTRSDVDIYLRGDDPAQKAAAMQTLQDKYNVIQRTQEEAQRQQRETETFNQTIGREVETQVEQTYVNLLETVAQNKAFTEVKVHGDANVDGFVKQTIINQIVALGDDNAILAKRAVESFKQMGVDVDHQKVNGILDSIKKNTEIAVRAERQAKARGQQTSAQAEEAKARVSSAVGQAVSLANRIAGEALKKYSPPSVVKDTPKDRQEPNFKRGDGGSRARDEGTGNGALKPQDLDALINNTVATLRETAQ
jgi:hypothetical protein